MRVPSPTTLRLALCLVALVLSASAGRSTASGAPPARDLGSNVIVFDPSMPVAQIQATVDAIHAVQVNNEVARNRYALLFKSGVDASAAAPLQMKVATTPRLPASARRRPT